MAKEEFNVDSAAAVYDSIKYLPGPAKRTQPHRGECGSPFRIRPGLRRHVRLRDRSL